MSEECSSKITSCLLLREWFVAGCANAIASSILNPIDVIKTRLQAKSSLNGPGHRIHGIISAIYTESGFIGLWKPGLSASISREMLYSGSRAGLYVPIRNYLRLDEDNGHNESVLPKIIAALMTGKYDSLL